MHPYIFMFMFISDPDVDEQFKEMVDRDKRKWQAADLDKDGKLSKKEFEAFLHPEEIDHMKDIVVLVGSKSKTKNEMKGLFCFTKNMFL